MRFHKIFTPKRTPRLSASALVNDWTTGWTTRDGADLPTHHLRREKVSAR